jgi:DNA replicative helicase MCM subunit Mcm2 (Cdc46/Mcm family)
VEVTEIERRNEDSSTAAAMMMMMMMMMMNDGGLFGVVVDVVRASGTSDESLLMSGPELEFLKTISATPNLFRTITHSLCPGIYGHDLVKGTHTLTFTHSHHSHIHTRTFIHTFTDALN